MKGFKPTGFGPSAGFKYPSSMGFTGSTGTVMNVSPHVRRFAKGGYVSKEVGDPGSSMVRRAKPSTEADRESGGKSPLRPGFQRGGMTSGAVKRAMAQMQRMQGSGALTDQDVRRSMPPGTGALTDAEVRAMRKPPKASRTYTGGGALGAALSAAARNAAERAKQESAVKRVPTPGVKGRFYDKGGKVNKGMGTYEYTPKPKYMDSVKYRIKEMLGFGDDDPNAGLVKRAEREMKSRTKKIDEASNYARGGKAKRMGYADGGGVKKKTGVSAAEAKKIAERTVGDHVRYPAPKGHRGLQKVMRKADGGEVSAKKRAEHAVITRKPGEKAPTLQELIAESRKEWEKQQLDKRSWQERLEKLSK
jgi:hypothetical protein